MAQPPSRQRFPNLASSAFEHPSDRSTLMALKAAPGLDWVFRKFNEWTGDRAKRLFCLSDKVRVDAQQCPSLHAILVDSCAILDMPVPQLYIDQLPFANAYTFGVDKPIIVVFSGLLELLDEAEWRVVLGHELGHIKSGHVLYRQIAEFLASLLQRLGGQTLGIGQTIGMGLFYAFFHWYRQSELTADRAGLLVCQDLDTVINVEMKMAGGSRKLYAQMDKDAFLLQGRDYEELGKDTLNQFYKMGQTLFMTHPFPAVRALEIEKWAHGPEYAAILRGQYPRADAEQADTKDRDDTPDDQGAKGSRSRRCPKCRTVVTESAFVFCPECGADLP